jgi:Cytochrome P460
MACRTLSQVGGAFCMLLISAGAALAGSELVSYPEGYGENFTHYTTRNRDDERKQVVRIFANQAALASAKAGGPLESGAVIVMEVYKAELDADGTPVKGSDGLFVPSELAAITVMEKRAGWGADYPEAWRNGEWEYAAFTADAHAPVERDYQPCFACHKPLAESDFLFSFEALKQAAGGS